MLLPSGYNGDKRKNTGSTKYVKMNFNMLLVAILLFLQIVFIMQVKGETWLMKGDYIRLRSRTSLSPMNNLFWWNRRRKRFLNVRGGVSFGRGGNNKNENKGSSQKLSSSSPSFPSMGRHVGGASSSVVAEHNQEKQQAQKHSVSESKSTPPQIPSNLSTPLMPSLPQPLTAPAVEASDISSTSLQQQQQQPLPFLPMPIPGTTPLKPRYLDVISIYANGTVIEHQVRKSVLSVELRCPTRDLRLLDNSFPSSTATFLARKSAIVVRMDHVRAIIKQGQIILFDPHRLQTLSLVSFIQQQMANVAATQAAVMGPKQFTSSFELLTLEVILAHCCHLVNEKLNSLTPRIEKILDDLKFRHGTLSSFPKLLDELLPLRNDLSELHYTVQELRKAMNDVLLSDEDMEKMYVLASWKARQSQNHLSAIFHKHQNRNHNNNNDHRSSASALNDATLSSSSSSAPLVNIPPQQQQQQQQHHHKSRDQQQEIEMLFENYLMQLEWVDTEIREIQHAIKNTEDTVEIQLDLLRNRILRFELVLNIITAVMSVGCLVTGLFGMNLLSGFEGHPSAFYIVTVSGSMLMLTVLGLVFFYGARRKLL